LRYTQRIALLLFVVAALLAVGYRTFHYLRGRRDRDAGIPCVQCRRTAFPVEGTTVRYRCWNCGCRFQGPEHF
jgi:hypothetical protein